MITKKLLFTIFTLLILKVSFAQRQKSKVTYKRNKDNSVTFSYSSFLPNSVFIMLNFKNLTNASDDIVKETISGYGGQITTLRPINPDNGIGFSYSTRTFIGNLEKEPDHNFKYILPIKKGNDIKVRYLSYLGKRFGNKEPENWKSFQFLTSLNDTVYAIRKGIVIRIVDKYNNDSSKEFNYRSKSNSITIEHNDGTLANYKVLRKNSMMVKVGDIVYPSAPLAVAGTYDKEENSQLRLSIYYLNKKVKDLPFDKKLSVNLSKRIHIYSYVNPLFCVDSENSATLLERNKSYTSNYDNTIIALEMTKRERKKWRKKGILIKKK